MTQQTKGRYQMRLYKGDMASFKKLKKLMKEADIATTIRVAVKEAIARRES